MQIVEKRSLAAVLDRPDGFRQLHTVRFSYVLLFAYWCDNDRVPLWVSLRRTGWHPGRGVGLSRSFGCTGGLYAAEAIQLLQRFYFQGNPRGDPLNPHPLVAAYM